MEVALRLCNLAMCGTLDILDMALVSFSEASPVESSSVPRTPPSPPLRPLSPSSPSSPPRYPANDRGRRRRIKFEVKSSKCGQQMVLASRRPPVRKNSLKSVRRCVSLLETIEEEGVTSNKAAGLCINIVNAHTPYYSQGSRSRA